MNAQIRPLWQLLPMHVSQLPRVMDIERRAYPFPWTEGIIRDCLKTGYSSWVAVDSDGAIAGYAVMSLNVDEAHVLNLCVDPAYQRGGLGWKLLDHVRGIARAANATLLLLEVRKSNKGAIALYERYGFKRLGLRKNYYPAAGGREDALVLGFDIP
jgi:ribosomal-protein-alanine N-acetyltransferase